MAIICLDVVVILCTSNDPKAIASLPTKSPSDDAGVRSGFRDESSLPRTQSTLAVPHDIIRHYNDALDCQCIPNDSIDFGSQSEKKELNYFDPHPTKRCLLHKVRYPDDKQGIFSICPYKKGLCRILHLLIDLLPSIDQYLNCLNG